MDIRGYQEPIDQIDKSIREKHRAMRSIIEELDSLDRCIQRIEVCEDMELEEILEHNAQEKKKHVAILLEWLRKHDAALSGELNNYLFSEKYLSQKRAEQSQ